MKIENIVHPYESFLDYRQKLLDLYEADYGEEEISRIKNRINHTLYLFDSDPLEMMIFLDDYEDQISDQEAIRKIEEEYENYIKVMNRIEKQINKELLKYMAAFFEISWRKAPSELLDLDYESFSYANSNKLRNPTVDNLAERLSIQERQKAYIEKCQELGIKPLTNLTYIHFILEEMDRLESVRNQRLLRETKWGKRIAKRLRKYNPQFTIEKIDTMMRTNQVASTHYTRDDNGNRNGICMYYPIVENIDRKALDDFLFHENRHVIESNQNSSGLSPYGSDDIYRLINEIRAEDKAIKDGKALAADPLWDNSPLAEGYFSLYEALIPLTHSLFDDYNEILNNFALHGRIFEFEEMFGKSDLLEFEKYLESLDCYMKRVKTASVVHDNTEDLEKSRAYVKKLRANANRGN